MATKFGQILYLETLCNIPVQTFKYIDQTDDEPTLGVVAQDVQAVAPELVCTTGFGETKAPDGSELLSVYETDLIYEILSFLKLNKLCFLDEYDKQKLSMLERLNYLEPQIFGGNTK